MTHSPEPWVRYNKCDDMIQAADHSVWCLQYAPPGDIYDPALQANIDRIITCVNFLRDIPTGLISAVTAEDSTPTGRPDLDRLWRLKELFLRLGGEDEREVNT